MLAFSHVCKLELIVGNTLGRESRNSKKERDIFFLRVGRAERSLGPKGSRNRGQIQVVAEVGGGSVSTCRVLLVGRTHTPRLPAVRHPHRQAWHRHARPACFQKTKGFEQFYECL